MASPAPGSRLQNSFANSDVFNLLAHSLGRRANNLVQEYGGNWFSIQALRASITTVPGTQILFWFPKKTCKHEPKLSGTQT